MSDDEANGQCFCLQSDHSPGKRGKVMELQSGQGRVGEKWEKVGNHNQFLQAREGKHIE